MTDALKPIVESLHYADVQFGYFTAPVTTTLGLDGKEIRGIPSINCGNDSSLSALHCFPYIKDLLDAYDAFLVACYSAHPLVGMLKREISRQAHDIKNPRKYVTGIFEASVSTCLALTRDFDIAPNVRMSRVASTSTFGIVTTGAVWKDELSAAVKKMLLGDRAGDDYTLEIFAGVGTTGLTAAELHTTPLEEVRTRITSVTSQLIKSSKNPVAAICLGCAGMSGMDAAVREGCFNALGPVDGKKVAIVDGVVSGVGILVNACKAGL